MSINLHTAYRITWPEFVFHSNMEQLFIEW